VLGLEDVEMSAYVESHSLLSELEDYQLVKKHFECPVYTVWGNHEDLKVIEKFRVGTYRVRNLHLLDESTYLETESIQIFGLGGNFLPGRKLFQKPLGGGAGKVWSVWSQYLDLVELATQHPKNDRVRVLVNHVSSGKEAFLTLLGARLDADLIVSGHMDPPHPHTWTEFAVRNLREAEKRISDCLVDLEKSVAAAPEVDKEELRRDLSHLGDLGGHIVRQGRGKWPAWYVSMIHLNLPDAPKGYAVIQVTNGDYRIDTYSK